RRVAGPRAEVVVAGAGRMPHVPLALDAAAAGVYPGVPDIELDVLDQPENTLEGAHVDVFRDAVVTLVIAIVACRLKRPRIWRRCEGIRQALRPTPRDRCRGTVGVGSQESADKHDETPGSHDKPPPFVRSVDRGLDR